MRFHHLAYQLAFTNPMTIPLQDIALRRETFQSLVEVHLNQPFKAQKPLKLLITFQAHAVQAGRALQKAILAEKCKEKRLV